MNVINIILQVLFVIRKKHSLRSTSKRINIKRIKIQVTTLRNSNYYLQLKVIKKLKYFVVKVVSHLKEK